MNSEEDIASLTIMMANDPRTMNKLVIYRPPSNIICQSELVSLWEKKTGRSLKRVFLPEAEMVRLSESKIETLITSFFIHVKSLNWLLTAYFKYVT